MYCENMISFQMKIKMLNYAYSFPLQIVDIQLEDGLLCPFLLVVLLCPCVCVCVSGGGGTPQSSLHHLKTEIPAVFCNR